VLCKTANTIRRSRKSYPIPRHIAGQKLLDFAQPCVVFPRETKKL
jgi:hypothetical protein